MQHNEVAFSGWISNTFVSDELNMLKLLRENERRAYIDWRR